MSPESKVEKPAEKDEPDDEICRDEENCFVCHECNQGGHHRRDCDEFKLRILREALVKAEQALVDVEWGGEGGSGYEGDFYPCCPNCGAKGSPIKPGEHKADCIVRAALKQIQELSK